MRNGFGFPFGVMRRFWSYTAGVVARCRECAKCHRIVHLKRVYVMLCEFHLNSKMAIENYIFLNDVKKAGNRGLIFAHQT